MKTQVFHAWWHLGHACRIHCQVVDLWDGNVEKEAEEGFALPWVISFCDGDKSANDDSNDDDEDHEMEGDCPSRITKRKLSGLLVSFCLLVWKV